MNRPKAAEQAGFLKLWAAAPRTLPEVIRRAQATREGGHTQRFHTVPVLGDASNARHQWGVAALYLQLHPEPKRDTLAHILMHDVAERWVGDTPAPAKYAMNPDLNKELLRAERLVENALDLPLQLEPGELKWVKSLDILECLMFAEDQIALGNRNLEHTRDNCRAILRDGAYPEVVREFAASYTWSRTRDIVPGETFNAIGQGQR